MENFKAFWNFNSLVVSKLKIVLRCMISVEMLVELSWPRFSRFVSSLVQEICVTDRQSYLLYILKAAKQIGKNHFSFKELIVEINATLTQGPFWLPIKIKPILLATLSIRNDLLFL